MDQHFIVARVVGTDNYEEFGPQLRAEYRAEMMSLEKKDMLVLVASHHGHQVVSAYLNGERVIGNDDR